MTSDKPWEPDEETYSKLEGTLQDTVNHGMDLLHERSRDISQLQARGQSVDVETVEEFSDSDDDDDDDDSFDGTYRYEDLSIKAMRKETSHTVALDVDRYAELLMDELGVTELRNEFGFTESHLKQLQHKLSSATTKRQRSGFVDAHALAKNWKIGIDAAKRTVEASTQLAVRDFTNSKGGRG